MDEFLDILTDEGKSTGVIRLKSEAHQLGLFHATVHIWFYTDCGQILMQKRGTQKETFPNHWDVSVAGHIHAGESIDEAAIREIHEEIGLTIDAQQLQEIKIRKNQIIHPNGIIDNEFQHVFISKLETAINELKMQAEEVADLGLFAMDTITECLAGHASKYLIVPAMQADFAFIKENIIKTL